jgi:cation:H+ antiporter
LVRREGWSALTAMPAALALPLFLLSLLVTLAAAGYFARRLDRLGIRLSFPEALIGLLTALAADAPELSSALIALLTGEHDVGVGVVIGSNLFNLAAMVGLSAILAGSVVLARTSLAIEGGVGLFATAVTAALILGAIGPVTCVVLLGAVLVPYVAVLASGPERLTRMHTPHAHIHADEATVVRIVVSLLVAVALVVLGSAGMVKGAVSLSDRWDIPRAFVGTIILAILTSLPNAFTAVRLGLARRGGALVSETFNSNTINLVGGIALPSLFIGLGAVTGTLRLELGWLLALNVLVVVALARVRGAGALAGWAIVGAYLAFVAVFVAGGG